MQRTFDALSRAATSRIACSARCAARAAWHALVEYAATGGTLSEVAVLENSALQLLAEEASGCTACALHLQRSKTVFGNGDPASEVVLLGEAPGELEDRTGEPFVGRSGRLLDEVLEGLGVKRSDVYVCNAVKCRPPANRTPVREEIAACSTFLHRQFALIAPRVVVALGSSAARALGLEFRALAEIRGAELALPWSNESAALMVTYHPAYVLRNRPKHEPVFRDDLEAAFSIARRVPSE